MSVSHEELVGGLGRAVFYRAKRVLVRNFLQHQEASVVLDDAIEHQLYDLSMNGVSFFAAKNGQRWEPGQEFRVAIMVKDRGEEVSRPEEVYRGTARVARADEDVAVHVGLQLTDGFLNLPQIQWNYEERLLRRDLRMGPQAVRDRLPAEYREAVDRASHFIHFYRQSLMRHEERYTRMGEAGEEAIRERAPLASAESLRDPFLALCTDAARAIESCLEDPQLVLAAKQYTETMITPALLECPIAQRCYLKPLGYAGDFDTMVQIYRNTFEGPTVFAKVFHKLAVEQPLAAGVRARKDMVRELHEEEYRRFCADSGPDEIFRVTNLGAGPAREILEFVEFNDGWSRPVHWTLIDQEEEALSLAYDQLYPKLAHARPPRTLRCMYMSFLQFLSDPSTSLADERQSLIYSVGLFDYIQDKRGKMIVSQLYQQLQPGGLLAIANAIWPNDHFWLCEFGLDWTLNYRSEQQMLALADELPQEADRRLVAEPNDAFWFLLVRKPGR